MKNVIWKHGVVATALGAVAFLGTTPSAKATLFDLTDGNSSASIDTGSQSGMYNWIVDGIDQLHQQWFWFRTEGMTSETSIDTLAIDVEGTSDTDFDNAPDSFFIRYLGQGFEIEVRYRLAGGQNGTGISDIAEQVTVHNTGEGRLNMSLFQYNDLDLGGTSDDRIVSITGDNLNTARQHDEEVMLNEVVATPPPTHVEVGEFSDTRTSLNDDGMTTLNDSTYLAGLADYTWAFQWDISLSPEGSFILSKDRGLRPMPAPGAALLASLGMGLVSWTRRRLA